MKKNTLLIIMLVIALGFVKEAKAIKWLSNQVYQYSYDMILPNNYTNKAMRFPVLYLLHGRNQHYYVWREESILITQMNQPGREFIVVLAEGQNSWYQSAERVKYIRTDLPTHIEQTYRATKVRGIGGLSMGGYGSFHISGQNNSVYPKDYKSVSSMSGAFIEPDEAETLDGVTIDKRDVLAGMTGPKKFPIFMDCGAQDEFSSWIFGTYSLKDKNEDMRDQLLIIKNAQNKPVRILSSNLFFYLPNGIHDWAYWNDRIPYHLDFHDSWFDKYPMISVTSFPENITTVVTNHTVRVSGITSASSAITSFVWKVESSGSTTKGDVTGTTGWHFDAPLKIGQNKIKITAVSSNKFSTFARLVLFRRNTSFRVRKVIVKENKIVAKTSDVTYGNIDSLTNGMEGAGYFRVGNAFLPVSHLNWKRAGQYVVKYKMKNDDYKFIIKVNGKAQKDFTVLNFKWMKKSTIATNLFDFIPLDTNIPLWLQFGFYGDTTNINLKSNAAGTKGKFKWDGKWFD